MRCNTAVWAALLLGTARSSGALLLRMGFSSSAASTAPTPIPVVTIARGKARLFRDGNPLVYGGAVAGVTGKTSPGCVVDVADGAGKVIGWGTYNESSMFRVRMLARVGEPLGDSRDLARLLDDRIRTAQKLRSAVGLPSPDTNCYRLVNGEGDLLSGLCVDVFGDTLSVASSALWVEVHREAIVASLTRSFGPDAQIVWKKSTGRLQQDGWPLVHATDGMESDEQEGEADDSPEDESQLQRDFSPITVTECGIKFKVQPWSGQKTGFYCDQRDNRQLLRGLCAGRSVLDVFCYTGGFGLTAAAGGASSVTAVDSSQGAVDLGKQNAALNGLTGAHFIKDDALQFMKRAATEGQKFDIVVLDPPKLAPNKKALPRATRKYTQLNAAAIKLVKENGLLLTFSCSSAMAQSGTFLSTVEAAASNVGRTITVLKTVGQACDHPVLVQMPESSYLTGALFSCGAEIEIQAGPPHSLSESAGRLSSQAEGSTNRRATRQRSP